MLSLMNFMDTSLHGHEDDDDSHIDLNDPDDSSLSKAEIRKSNKPIMEKRRRARINTCLNELKSLILDALKKDPSRHSKLEKADILEMTVKHLQAVQRQQLAMAVAHNPSVLNKFKGGFNECSQEISRYMNRMDNVDAGVRHRLQQHLSHCTGSLNSTTPMSFTAMAGLPMSYPPGPPPPPPSADMNNNQARLLHRFVAARLAAAGDNAGAALLLQGGLSLLARGTPQTNLSQNPPPQSSPQAPSQSGIPQSVPNTYVPSSQLRSTSHSAPTYNAGASSSTSTGLSSPRVSAFTAVKRSSSPPRPISDSRVISNQNFEEKKTPTIVAPTAIRPVLRPENQPKMIVQAQVAMKPFNHSRDEELSAPLEFPFAKNCFVNDRKRSLQDPPPYSIPSKVIKIEEVNLVPSPTRSPLNGNYRKQNSLSPSSDREELNDEGDKDMWRPW